MQNYPACKELSKCNGLKYSVKEEKKIVIYSINLYSKDNCMYNEDRY